MTEDRDLITSLPLEIDSSNPHRHKTNQPHALHFDKCENDPEFLVDVLRKRGGDINKYAISFRSQGHGDHIQKIITRTYIILNKIGNEEYKRDWKDLINAHNEAKLDIAEHKAFEFVSRYHLPKSGRGIKAADRAPISAHLSLLKHLAAPKTALETTRAKKKGNIDTPIEAPQDALVNFLDQMKEGVE